jgi:hypothetical protein
MHKAKGFHNLGALGAFSTAWSTCSPTTPYTYLSDPHITKPTMGVLLIQTLFLVQIQSQTQRKKPSSLCTELISFGDWVTRILFLCIHTHVNKMGVKHTEHKYHLQLLGACQHRHDTIHNRAIHLCSSYLYKKTPITQPCYTYPNFPFIRECDQNILRVVGSKDYWVDLQIRRFCKFAQV